MDFLIREARPDDVGMIVKMIFELAVYERQEDLCRATPEALKVHLFGPRPRVEGLVAEVDGKLAGYALFFHNYSTWECAPGIYLEDLYVRPTYRRLGIGRAFLEQVAALAVERGCKRFEWAVLDWNQPAIEFYQSLGAEIQREWLPCRLEGDALGKLAAQFQPPAIEEAEDDAPFFDQGKEPPLVVVHTDGGCDPNPGTGGWAAILRSGSRVREISGGELDSTNNRMEMTAAIRALETLKSPCRVELHTDSQYLKNGITSWIKNWKRNNWMRGKGRDAAPVKNVDLWKRLDELCGKHQVEWAWLRGHAGHEDNERCDELCTAEIRKLQGK